MMKRKNYESDFVAKMTLPQNMERADFEIEFATCGIAKYRVSRKGDVHVNCKTCDDGVVLVIFKNHGLSAGMLRSRFVSFLVNGDMPDGVQKCVTPRMEDVELVAGAGDECGDVDFAIAVDYAVVDAYDMAVDAGYEGTREEYIDMIFRKPVVTGRLIIETTGDTNVTIDDKPLVINGAGYHDIEVPLGGSLKIKSDTIIGIHRYDGIIVWGFARRKIQFVKNTTIELDGQLCNGATRLSDIRDCKIVVRDDIYNGYAIFKDTAITAAPYFDCAKMPDIDDLYNNCKNLTSAPYMDTSKITSFKNMFFNCDSIVAVPLYDTSKATTIHGMFTACYNLRSLPKFNFASVANATCAFMLCNSIIEFPSYFNFSKLVTAPYIFGGDWGFYNEQKDTYAAGSLRRFPAYSLPEVTDMLGAWQDQSKLYNLGKINMPKCTNLGSAFSGCFNLTAVGGFTGLKCNINMAHCSKLTVVSLVAIMTEAADVKAIGVRTMTFGAVNLAKLSDAQKAIAIDKGWSLV